MWPGLVGRPKVSKEERKTSETEDSTGQGNDKSQPSAAELAAENARLKGELDGTRAAAKRKGRLRTRSVLTGILVALTSVCIVGATIGVWTKRTVSNTDRYVALVAPLAKDPAVTNALAGRLTDEVFVALNIQPRVKDALASIPNLPPQAGLLAGPITAGAQNLIESQVQTFLRSDTFANLWAELNRQVHDKLQALLNGDYSQLPNVAINGGEVQLNLVSAVAAILQQLVQTGANALGINVTIPSIPANLDASAAIAQLGSALGVSLPADFGQVTIMTARQLNSYQKAAQDLKKLVGLLFLLSLLLLVTTIIVSPDRRRAVIWLGAGVVVALFLGGVFLRHLKSVILDAIVGPGAKAAAGDVFAQVGSSLRRAGLLVLVVALLAAIVAYLAGRPSWLQRATASIRRMTARRPQGSSDLEVWVASHTDAVRIGAIVVAVVVLFFTGIDWVPVAIVGALLALFLWWVTVAGQRVHAAVPGNPQPS